MLLNSFVLCFFFLTKVAAEELTNYFSHPFCGKKIREADTNDIRYNFEEIRGDNSSEKPLKVLAAIELKDGRYVVIFPWFMTTLQKPKEHNNYPRIDGGPDNNEEEMPFNSVQAGTPFYTEDFRREYEFLFLNSLVCQFVARNRIECLSNINAKKYWFPFAFDLMTPAKSYAMFAAEVYNRKNVFDLVLDDTEQKKRFIYREGKQKIAEFLIKSEYDSTVIIKRRRAFVEGFGFERDEYWKFMFVLSEKYTADSEKYRVLWGTIEEFLGCPKRFCAAPALDTLMTLPLKDGKSHTYLFRGNYIYNKHDLNGLPLSVSLGPFLYLIGNLDASFYDPFDKQAYFIKDDNVFKYDATKSLNTQIINTETSKGTFPQLPKRIGAAFLWKPNRTVYLFEGYQYWAYDIKRRRMHAAYPRNVTDFHGLPADIDAADSDLMGNYYLFYGPFVYKFTEDQGFNIGQIFEPQVSVKQFFTNCDDSFYKKFTSYSSKTHFVETIDKYRPVPAAKLMKYYSDFEMKKEESTLQFLSELMLFGPFNYRAFVG